jgi:trehalose 6-phosphate synthase
MSRTLHADRYVSHTTDVSPTYVTASEESASKRPRAAWGPARRIPAGFTQADLADAFDVPLVVVANREPYSHRYVAPGEIEVTTAAGGLVSALEPVLRATGGTWIAHGSADADLESCDSDGCLAVPPDLPQYTLRRVFLEDAEAERYYSGFANEALWPLCHNVFTKPSFRDEDWRAYRRVNQRFAAAALERTSGVILLQDYHFALAGRFIRDADRSQVIASFWHIPWPSAEIFRICPWTEELLDGLLALDLLGFHTERYCTNFLDTVEQTLDCEIDRRSMTVRYRGTTTRVRAIPISIDPSDFRRPAFAEELRGELAGPNVHVSVAVDRIDYTKGIVERYRAIESLLERHPELRGRYLLLQIAAPCRSNVSAYRDLESLVSSEADRINRRFGHDGWQPIKLLVRNVPRNEVLRYYSIADSALVTPLHDGMNLVAKEYAALCTEERGVLILSRFAGAAEELRSALLVNPFDTDAVADSIYQAIHMSRSERQARTRAMHAAVSSNTIFDWAGTLFAQLRFIAGERSGQPGHAFRQRGSAFGTADANAR